MKKFITLLSAALIAVASLATVASAAPIAEDTFKPTIEADITKVTSKGKATITYKINVASELDFTFDEDEEVYTGFGMRAWQIDMDLNDDIFVEDTVSAPNFTNTLEGVLASVNGVATFTASAYLEDAYIGKSAEEINNLDFGKVTFAEFVISSWEETDKFSEELTQTKYRSDAAGDFVIDLSATRIGTYVPGSEEPAADVTVSAKTDADAAWEAETGKNAVYWGVDFADGKFPGSAKATFTAGEDKRELNITYDESFNINGEVSFAIYVIADETITNAVTMALEAADCTVKYN